MNTPAWVGYVVGEDPRLTRLREIDDELADKGWVRISPWWWNVVERSYKAGVPGVVITGGRRGGKSSTLAAKVACAELTTTITTDAGLEVPFHKIPPGDVGYFGMISAEKEQAKARVATTKKALRDLGVSFEKDAIEEIVIAGRRLGVKAITASLSGVVSFTCIGALCDEMALWKDKESDTNPAEEVVRSLKPTTATCPGAIIWYVSAPWARVGLHYDMSRQGDNEAQLVFHGASWEMNPTLTESATHRLERDYNTWLRSYAAIPMDSDEKKFFSLEFINACAGVTDDLADEVKERLALVRRQQERAELVHRVTAGGDFAFRRDSAAMVAIALTGDEFVSVRASRELIPRGRALRPTATITELTQLAVAAGADSFACDMHYIDSVAEVVEDLPLELQEFPSNEKHEWYVRLRILISEFLLDLRNADPRLIEQLKAVTGKPLDGGGMKIEVKRNEGLAHGDLVSGLVHAVWSMEQPTPEKKPFIGSRRFGRGGDDSGRRQMRDLPPTD